MFRNQYDNDVTTWSPQGRLHQVEYAMEAVKQGSCTLGLKSKSHVVLLGLKRSANELSTHQRKLLKIDDHIVISISGLTSDSRTISKLMRTECMNQKFTFENPLPISRLMTTISDKAQLTTQQYGRRPYGVGILVGGVDESGPRLFQFCPSSNYFDCKAMAIGARSQSARTYLEKHLDEFHDSDLDELIRHGCMALRESLTNDTTLNISNTSIAFITNGKPCEFLNEEQIDFYLRNLEGFKKESNDNEKNEPMDVEMTYEDA